MRTIMRAIMRAVIRATMRAVYIMRTIIRYYKGLE